MMNSDLSNLISWHLFLLPKCLYSEEVNSYSYDNPHVKAGQLALGLEWGFVLLRFVRERERLSSFQIFFKGVRHQI